MSIKQKWTAAVLAALIAALSLTGCDHDTSKKSDTTAEVTTEVQTAPETTDPHEAERATLRDEVLGLLNSSESDESNPMAVFDLFDHKDYVIGKITACEGYDGTQWKEIFNRDGISGMIERTEGWGYFAKHQNGNLVQVLGIPEYNRIVDAELLDVAPAEPYTPSLFHDFGFDLPFAGLGNPEAPETSEGPDEKPAEWPVLTADQIEVSEDLTECTFAKEYLDGIRNFCAKLFSDTEADRRDMEETMSVTGAFSAADRTITLTMKKNHPVEGDLEFCIRAGYGVGEGDDDGQFATLNFRKTIEMQGMMIPVEVEIMLYNIEYDGDRPVRASVKFNTEGHYEDEVNGVPIAVSYKERKNYSVNARDEKRPEVMLQETKDTRVTVDGKTDVTRTTNRLTIKPLSGSSGMQLEYALTENGQKLEYLVGQLRFSNNLIPEIPHVVLREFRHAR